MAIKRQFEVTATFSMASMTDVIFLLLIFFMVTSTFVMPMAMDVNLPESSSEAPVKPSARIFVNNQGSVYVSYDNEEPQAADPEQLLAFLKLSQEQTPESYVAVYADEDVTYGRLIEVLDAGAANGIKMVLATKKAPESVRPSLDGKSQKPDAAAAAPTAPTNSTPNSNATPQQ